MFSLGILLLSDVVFLKALASYIFLSSSGPSYGPRNRGIYAFMLLIAVLQYGHSWAVLGIKSRQFGQEFDIGGIQSLNPC